MGGATNDPLDDQFPYVQDERLCIKLSSVPDPADTVCVLCAASIGLKQQKNQNKINNLVMLIA